MWQFLLINLGFYFIFFVLFKIIAFRNQKAIQGSIATFLIFIASDLLMPEFHVGLNGLIQGATFGMASTDYFFGYIYSTFLNIQGFWLWIMVYPVTFIILFLVGALLFKDFTNKVE